MRRREEKTREEGGGGGNTKSARSFPSSSRKKLEDPPQLMNSEIDIDVVVIICSWRDDGTCWTCSEGCLTVERSTNERKDEEVSSRSLSFTWNRIAETLTGRYPS